ncbi:protein PIEZO homolog isoform X1 [Drosophila sulfurigaster albostrigata]|uniref:protein PIEZO homolog isoform X1 n=1 Tax=Drosophila sulfurigaster albostrigata TaxID=89887 RepID=UPI002D21A48C|nr:protein PIEZO homolog isoform X1 [Drosophila sulfurigaster albostrigata]
MVVIQFLEDFSVFKAQSHPAVVGSGFPWCARLFKRLKANKIASCAKVFVKCVVSVFVKSKVRQQQQQQRLQHQQQQQQQRQTTTTKERNSDNRKFCLQMLWT